MSLHLSKSEWILDPKIRYLNHGSFGACPRVVLDAQARLRERMEQQPVQFMTKEFPTLRDEARRTLAKFLSAYEEDVVFVSNATAGVNSVLRSLTFEPGDEILTTDHVYPACRRALDFIALQKSARIVVAEVPCPIRQPSDVTAALLSKVTKRTRLALVDHVTSPTAVIFPIEEIVGELQKRGVEVLVDGAHAPGMLPLDLNRIGAAYYTGNLHKWMCAPKGAAFLHVRRDRHDAVHPLSISHGWTELPAHQTRLHEAFDWTGTDDFTAWLSVPCALEFLQSHTPGGITAVMAHNHGLVLKARAHLAETLEVELPCPDEMIGSMASLPLSMSATPEQLHDLLLEKFRIEVPIFIWGSSAQMWVRVSAQMYNEFKDFQHLAGTLWGLQKSPMLK